MSSPNYTTLVRSMPVAEVGFSENELEAILVPWDKPARVFDPEEIEPYDEGFRPGAFDVQLRRPTFSPATVPLLPRHGSSETFGHTRRLSNAELGLHGVIAVRPSLRSDVEQMVADGIDSMSIEFHPMQRSPRIAADGVRWRDHAVLVAVALTPAPAYADAKVLALRSDAEIADLERQSRYAEIDAELDELRASRWAIK